jgi:antiphage defense system Thoeris ThsB-like protein
MIKTNTVDLFITHAWRYHQDWKHLVDILNAHDARGWRNFSLPWYDPALDPRTEKGGAVVRWNLESQIIPAHAVILLDSVVTEPGTRKWLDYELKMATKHHKPVLALPRWAESDVSAEVKERADTILTWDAAAILTAVESVVTGWPGLRYSEAPVQPPPGLWSTSAPATLD